jgi:hypothetical protein
MPENFATKTDPTDFIGGAWLIQNEIAAGYRIVRVGEAPWLPLEDWDTSSIVSQGRFRVRLVALRARNPGNGAFTRLVATIQAEGRLPVVVEPFNDLAMILKRWNWKRRMTGRGVKRHCIFHPRTPWKNNT